MIEIDSVFMNHYGYQMAYISGRGKIELHRLVWETQYGPIPKGFIVHHKDKNKLNNDITNLECVSRKEHNAIHNTGVRRSQETIEKMRVGRIRRNVRCVESGKIFRGINSAAKAIGVRPPAISNCANGYSKTSGGYHWEYTSDPSTTN